MPNELQVRNVPAKDRSTRGLVELGFAIRAAPVGEGLEPGLHTVLATERGQRYILCLGFLGGHRECVPLREYRPAGWKLNPQQVPKGRLLFSGRWHGRVSPRWVREDA